MEIFLDELALADQKQPKHMKFLSEIPKSLGGRHYGRNSDGGIGFNTTLRDRVEKLKLEEDFFDTTFGKRANSITVQPK